MVTLNEKLTSFREHHERESDAQVYYARYELQVATKDEVWCIQATLRSTK